MSDGARRSQDDLPTSSFPMSSPTFWDEAARVTQNQEELAAEKGTEVTSTSKDTSEHDDLGDVIPSSPLAKVEMDEKHEMANRHVGSSGTTLSYLPHRTDPYADLTSHAYLAGAEYAPNRFGDIGDYMRKKEIKVQTQNRDIAMSDPAAALLPQIFKDISFYINGNTHPPMEELRKMILQRGGEVRPVLRSKGMVKFIIAPMLTQMKFKQFQNYKVVREGWILESCKEGKLLDWTRWKLAIQGGWEEEGRKGLEGFFRGTPTRRAKRERDEEEEEEEEPIEEREPKKLHREELTPVTPVVDTKPKFQDVVLPLKEDIAEPAPKPPQTPRTRSSTGAEPLRIASPVIPISPGQEASPGKDKLPAKIQRPEGMWEFYASKESNQDAARLLKDQEWRLKNTAERGNEGGFIDGYYQNSRLHHLSTWKAELRVLVAAAQRQSEENSLKAPSNKSIVPEFSLSTSVLPIRAPANAGSGDKVIFHVDFDCFFVSCGLATRPHLRGKPAVVCHSTGGRQEGSTSEIASASYEARAKGVRNGMSLGRARTLVGEDLETLPYEFETYKKFSLAFYTVLMGYADELQAVSVDEALIDVTGAVATREAAPEEAEETRDDDGMGEPGIKPRRDPAVEIAEKIRDEIRKETGCEGISHNVLLSKLATRRAKPAGVYHLLPAEIPTFLAPLDVEDFPSVGYSIRSKIEEKFGSTISGELMEHPKGAFRGVLGPKTGEMVWGYLRGIDERKLEPHKERKSISAEMNYGIRFRNDDQAEICVRDLAAEVSKRMKQVNAKGRLLTLKLMKRHPDAPVEPPKFLGHGWCETFNKSSAVGTKGGASTDDPEILGQEAVKLLRSLGLDPTELRGVGIQMTKLDGERAEREAGQGVLSFSGLRRGRSATVKEESTLQERAEDRAVEAVEEKKPEESARHRDGSPVKPPSPLLEQRDATAGPSRLRPAPSSDAIDPDFLAALPEELQREVKQEHARTRAAKKASLEVPKPAPLPAPPKPQAKVAAGKTDAPGTINSIPPTRLKDTVGSTVPFWSKLDHAINKDGRHSAAHISKQLRPKMKTQLRAGQIADLALYSAWNKAKVGDRDDPVRDIEDDRTVEEEVEVLDLTESPKAIEKGKRKREVTEPPLEVEGLENVDTGEKGEEDDLAKIGLFFVKDLKEIGIDPSVFAELPADMQKEVVAEERQKHRQRLILHRPADTSRIRAKEREADRSRGFSRTISVSPSRARAGSVPIASRPVIVRPETRRPSMLNAQRLPDVLETITKWVESRKGNGPAERDARKVEAYMVKLVDPASGLGGVEAAVECLKWMRMILKEKYRDEMAEQGPIDWWGVSEKERRVGKEWWDTWRKMFGSVSKRCEETLGAPIRL